MHKKHIFLRVFQKITIFACVFCVCSALAETTTCDINYTPVTGNSIQNGTPTPTSPVEIESIGTKVGNKYQISVTAQGKNLFDGQWQQGTFQNNGTEASSNTRIRTDFINVTPGAYTISSATDNVVIHEVYWYDANKQFVLKQPSPYAGIVAPSGSAYIRFSARYSDNADILPSSAIKAQIELGSTATPYAPYSAPTTTPIYLNAPLRKVGDYADILDYKKGHIIRNVGVKVLDGTEDWVAATSQQYLGNWYCDNLLPDAVIRAAGFCTHFEMTGALGYGECIVTTNGRLNCWYGSTGGNFKQYLAEQYAAGTPVIVYYPLATPVVEQIENWSCPVPITDIQIATTKMVDDEFAQAEANLAATVQTIESVVSRTITQTGQIATLQETKQTRPDETCPANMKCLLVQDEDGTPHWYPIIEP